MLNDFLVYSKWDSEILQINYYKLEKFSLKKWPLVFKEIDNIPKNSIVFSRINSSNLDEINLLLNNNFYISDLLTEFTFKFLKSFKPLKKNQNLKILTNNQFFINQCLEMIQREFIIGRIHEDKNLGLDSGRRIYKEWALTNFKKNQTISYIENDVVKGFVQYSIYHDVLRIIFIVVAEDYKNCGIGTALINMIKNVAFNSNCQSILVGTQSKNKNAINFYIKNSFQVNNSFHGLHYYVK